MCIYNGDAISGSHSTEESQTTMCLFLLLDTFKWVCVNVCADYFYVFVQVRITTDKWFYHENTGMIVIKILNFNFRLMNRLLEMLLEFGKLDEFHEIRFLFFLMWRI